MHEVTHEVECIKYKVASIGLEVPGCRYQGVIKRELLIAIYNFGQAQLQLQLQLQLELRLALIPINPTTHPPT